MDIFLSSCFFRRTKMRVRDFLFCFLPLYPILVLEVLFWLSLFWVLDRQKDIQKRMDRYPVWPYTTEEV